MSLTLTREISGLMSKAAIEQVDQQIHSLYVLIPKQDGGFRLKRAKPVLKGFNLLCVVHSRGLRLVCQ